MRMLIVSGLLLASTLGVAPAHADDGVAGWTCAADDDTGHARVEYDENRQPSGRGGIVWGPATGPLRLAFGLPVVERGRLAPPAQLRVIVEPTAAATKPERLEVVADGQVLFSDHVVLHPYPFPDGAAFSKVFYSRPEQEAKVVTGAWSARSLRLRFLDADGRTVADATFDLPASEGRGLPLLARVEAGFDDPNVCKVRYWQY